MKKNILIILVITLIFSCSGDSDDNDNNSNTAENNPPTSPILVFPTNGLLCINNLINFQWDSASDPDGDSISYILEVATNNQFSPLLNSSALSGTFKDILLPKGQLFYWRVKARDANNVDSNYSSVFSFYTEGDGVVNHLPSAPELISPELNTSLQQSSTELKWSATDVDTEDILTYDVYFGHTNPPNDLIAENQLDTNFEVQLAESVEYYWQVIVKDDKGGTAIGQIWNFSKE